MSRLSLPRIAGGIAAVLIIAAVFFVVRGTAHHDRTSVPAIAKGPAAGSSPDQAFTLRDAAPRIVPRGASVIATAKDRSVEVYRNPRSKHPRRLDERIFNKQRIPLTFLVLGRRKGWVNVQLPTRPNQSSAWLHRDRVDLSFTPLKLEVRRRTHELRLMDGDRTLVRTKIGVGKSLSPTPSGRYFVTDIVRTPNPKGFYGPYALGLSAHSTVYTSFEGGDGQVGIHGTDQPAGLGTDVSHGCIRVANAVIAKLAREVPLGTPVTISR